MRWITAFAILSTAAHAATLHVSPDGDDPADGTLAHPLRTIQAGIDRMRPGDTLLLHAGVYRETVTFQHGGEPGQPLTIRPFERDEVTITGCDPVDGWSKDTGNVWRAPMPWTLGPGRNQVFAGGDVMVEARHPNVSDEGWEMYVSGLSPLWPTFAASSMPNPKDEPGRIVSQAFDGAPDDAWQGAIYYGVHYEGWAAQTGVVEHSTGDSIQVGDRTRGWWFGPAYGGGYKPEEGHGMLVGARRALDAPGEFFWQDGNLYLIPDGDGPPTGIEAKRRQLAFDLSGRSHIVIQGLNVHAASVRMQESAFCTFDDCRLRYISHFWKHYGMGQLEDGRDTIKSGETGLYVSGHDNRFLNCTVQYSAGAGFHLRGYHHTIHNCLIDEVDYCAHYLNAITDAVGDYNDWEHFLVGGHVITYNTMRNAGRHFFNFYGNGTSQASRDRGPMDYMATLFAHNHLYNGMLQTKDAGFLTGYYSSGGTLDGLNSQVCHNVMHDCYDTFAMRINKLGIVYLDAGSCDVDLWNNLLWAAPGSHQRGLWYNTMCVDVHERDNTFHPEFPKTCADLAPEDFPQATPFRFGHDWTSPPPLVQWPQLGRREIAASGILRHGTVLDLGEVDLADWQSAILRYASDLKPLNTDRSGRQRPRHQHPTDPLVMEAIVRDGAHDKIGQQWTFIHSIPNGGWIRFNQVPLGDGYRRLRVVYGNDQPLPRRLEVRLDAVDGPLVGTVELPQTDVARGSRIQIYAEATGAIDAVAKGTRDVFLVFHTEDGKNLGEFEYFRFEQYRGAIGLQPNEARVELRADRPDGELLGTLFPRATNGLAREVVAKLEPASGTRRLYLTVRAATDQPIASLAGLRLEKARPIDWTGIGLPPRAVAGRPVYPEPTHRPQARPNDKYAHGPEPAGSRPRPLHAVARTDRAPAIDGRLDDWSTALAHALPLAESYDGRPSSGSLSLAWLRYDDQALYLAAQHRLKRGTTATVADHVWGRSDAMELAWQDAASPDAPILNLYGWPDGHFESVATAGAPPAAVARLQQAVTYAASVTDDGWACEWRIPFAACGYTPATAPTLRFNLGARKLAEDAWVIWRGTGEATFKVADAGLVFFPAELAAAGAIPRDGLALWLDAAERGSLQLDDARRVAGWQDRSGHARHAVQTLPAHRPWYVADGLQGRPALRFDEQATTRFELPDLSDQKITATVLAVISNPVAGSQVNHNPRILTASDGTGYDYQVGLALDVPGMQTGGPRLLQGVYRDRWAKVVRVGCFSPHYQTWFTGLLSELLVYDRELQPDEADLLRAYLVAKWGLDAP